MSDAHDIAKALIHQVKNNDGNSVFLSPTSATMLAEAHLASCPTASVRVRTADTPDRTTGVIAGDVIVEILTDGRWETLVTFCRQAGDDPATFTARAVRDADHWASIWTAGARFAGAHINLSSNGYNL